MAGITDLLSLLGSGVSLAESLNKNKQANDIVSKGTDTSAITQQQLAASKSLFDLLNGTNAPMQQDLSQLDPTFLQPGVSQFQPAYATANQRFQQGDAYSPETLRALLADKARRGVSDAYDNITNATTMQALRTGTNAGETLRTLAMQRAKDTASALTDAELQAITGSESMNLARQQANQQGLTAAQSPLADALKTRALAATNQFTTGAGLRNTAASGMFDNIRSGFGTQANAAAGGVNAGYNMLQNQPFGTAIGTGGMALNNLFNTDPNKKPQQFPNGNSGELMF